MIREFIIAEKKVRLNRNSNKIVVENSNHKKKKKKKKFKLEQNSKGK